MRIYLLFIFFLTLMGCKSNNPLQKINQELVNEIIVSDPYIYENNTAKSGIGVDTIRYKSENKLFIRGLFLAYLKKAKEKQVKLFYPYELSFTYNDENYSLFIGQNYFMFEGISYEANNIGIYIEEELKIEKKHIK